MMPPEHTAPSGDAHRPGPAELLAAHGIHPDAAELTELDRYWADLSRRRAALDPALLGDYRDPMVFRAPVTGAGDR